MLVRKSLALWAGLTDFGSPAPRTPPRDRRHPRGGLQSIFRFRVSSDRRGARRFTSTEAPSESAVDKTEPEEVHVDSSGASVQEVEDSAVDVVDRDIPERLADFSKRVTRRICNCACANLRILPIMLVTRTSRFYAGIMRASLNRTYSQLAQHTKEHSQWLWHTMYFHPAGRYIPTCVVQI